MNADSLVLPSRGDDRRKIFLTNLDGRVNTEDLHRFFRRFGPIDHVESWSTKSAIILFADQLSVDRVLSKFRKCEINHQEIFVRRIRAGPVERAYQDSPIVMISPSDSDFDRTEWTEENLRRCLNEYDEEIEKIHLASNGSLAWIYFRDYDSVDRLLLQSHVFRLDGKTLHLKRAKNEEKNRDGVERLVKMNQILKRQIKRK